MHYVYRLDYLKGAEFYIGRTKNPKQRFAQHFADCWTKDIKFYQFLRATEISDWKMTILSEHDSLADANQEELNMIHETQAYNVLNSKTGVKGLEAQRVQGLPLIKYMEANGSWHAGKVGVYSEKTLAKMSKAKVGNTAAKDFHADPIKHAEWLKTMKAMGKAVICHETGEIFASVAEVAARFNVGRCDVRRVCNGKRAKAARHTFSWYTET